MGERWADARWLGKFPFQSVWDFEAI